VPRRGLLGWFRPGPGSPISGAVLYDPPQRGAFTFVPLADVPFEEWRRRRGRVGAVAEVAVGYAVHDMAAITRAVFRAEATGWTQIWSESRFT